MRDLTTWKGCPPPARLVASGRTVAIEPYEEAVHAQALWDAFGGEATNELIRYFPNGPYRSAAEMGAWLTGFNASGEWVTLVFRSVATGAVVGMASYMRIDPANGSVEVGSVAHGPDMARTPMATEAHYLMARHVFDDLGYRRYEWKCHNDNAPSKAAAIRLGFTFEGIFRQHMVAKGANRDTAWYSMIDAEWPAIRAAFEHWLDPNNFDTNGRQIARLEDIRETMRGRAAQG